MSELASDLDQLLARARNVDPMVTSDLDLELLAVELRYQSDRIEKSQDRFKNMKRGPKKQLAHQFVALIAMFLEMYTDQLITRSDKDLLLRNFIVDLCAIADLSIGRSNIDQH